MRTRLVVLLVNGHARFCVYRVRNAVHRVRDCYFRVRRAAALFFGEWILLGTRTMFWRTGGRQLQPRKTHSSSPKLGIGSPVAG